MLTSLRSIFIPLFLSPLFLLAQESKIRVALASSLVPAMKEIKTAFESEHQVEIELIPGASGTLASQILHGAPFDIFISANKKYSQLLFEKGVLNSKPRDLAEGTLILWSDRKIEYWSAANSDALISKLLLNTTTKTIAIAQPGLAPYGDAALTYLEALGILPMINHKLIYGNNLSITNQYIYSGGANAVITSLASQKALVEEKTQYWYTIDSTTNLTHSVCLLSGSNANAQNFYDFLFDSKSLSILEAYGYLKINR